MSELTVDIPVELKLEATLDYTVIRVDRTRIELPLMSVHVSPEIRDPEVERVGLLHFFIDLGVAEDSLKVDVTFEVTVVKKPPLPIPSMFRKLLHRKETFTIVKTAIVRTPPEKTEKYWRIMYLILRNRYVKVKVYYGGRDQAESSPLRVLDLHLRRDLETKIIESFQRVVLEKLPVRIYSNPAYLKALESRDRLRELPMRVLRELAEYGIVTFNKARPELTYFGRMFRLWAERRGRLFARALIDAETRALEETLKLEERETYRLGGEFEPEKFYPCLDEVYAERLSEELIKNGVLTPSQSYIAGRLLEYFSSPPERPFIVYGVRGVGKTFTVRYVLEDNYRYTYVDKADWNVKTISKGEPIVEVFDDWHYLCEGAIRGLIEIGEFRRFLEMLRGCVGVKHLVLVSDEIPTSYFHKLPEDVAGIVEELVGLTIGWKVSLENVNILELEPSSIAEYLKHMEGPDKSKELIEYLCRGRLRRLAKILKQFDGKIPTPQELIEWVGAKLGIDREQTELLVAKLTGDERKLQEIFNEKFREGIICLERLKIVRASRKPGREARVKKRLSKTGIEEEMRKVRLRVETAYRNAMAMIESNLPRLFDEDRS